MNVIWDGQGQDEEYDRDFWNESVPEQREPKTPQDRVRQVFQISERIRAMKDAHKAARYFRFWVAVINRQPIFRSQHSA